VLAVGVYLQRVRESLRQRRIAAGHHGGTLALIHGQSLQCHPALA
jgi:hypothetical protein